MFKFIVVSILVTFPHISFCCDKCDHIVNHLECMKHFKSNDHYYTEDLMERAYLQGKIDTYDELILLLTEE